MQRVKHRIDELPDAAPETDSNNSAKSKKPKIEETLPDVVSAAESAARAVASNLNAGWNLLPYGDEAKIAIPDFIGMTGLIATDVKPDWMDKEKESEFFANESASNSAIIPAEIGVPEVSALIKAKPKPPVKAKKTSAETKHETRTKKNVEKERRAQRKVEKEKRAQRKMEKAEALALAKSEQAAERAAVRKQIIAERNALYGSAIPNTPDTVGLVANSLLASPRSTEVTPLQSPPSPAG